MYFIYISLFIFFFSRSTTRIFTTHYDGHFYINTLKFAIIIKVQENKQLILMSYKCFFIMSYSHLFSDYDLAILSYDSKRQILQHFQKDTLLLQKNRKLCSIYKKILNRNVCSFPASLY